MKLGQIFSGNFLKAEDLAGRTVAEVGGCAVLSSYFMNRLSLILLALALCGCDPNGTPTTYRITVLGPNNETVQVWTNIGYPGIGGSYCYFTTAEGKSVRIHGPYIIEQE